MRNLLAALAVLGILAGVGAAIFFFGGFYDVGATAWEPPIIRSILISVREASVRRYAVDPSPVDLDDPAVIRAGARSYADRGCINCHGGPGVLWAKFSEGLRPDPPDLKIIARDRKPAEIFWVLKNGINMTGMPGFGAAADRDLWSIVAFVRKLPDVRDEDFKTWSGLAPEPTKP